MPLSRTSIILALDISGSMCATDIEPNRLTVAKEAAHDFVKDQVAGTRIGIVAFAGFAQLIVPPTTDKAKLTDAIDSLTTARGTVIGSAMLQGARRHRGREPGRAPVGPTSAAIQAHATPPRRRHRTAGRRLRARHHRLAHRRSEHRGIDPVDAAQQAAGQRVRVYTIGFGTTNPTRMVCHESNSVPARSTDGGFGGGFTVGTVRPEAACARLS